MPLKSKDFFGLRDMSADDIRYILGTAETMKYILNQKNKKTPHTNAWGILIVFINLYYLFFHLCRTY